MSFGLRELIDLLNPVLRQALERAAAEALERRHDQVSVGHVLWALTRDGQKNDVVEILRHHEISRAKVQYGLTFLLAATPTGAGRTPAFSPDLPAVLERAADQCQTRFRIRRTRSGSFLLAAMLHQNTKGMLDKAVPDLAAVNWRNLEGDFFDIVADSPESSEAGALEEPAIVPRPFRVSREDIQKYTGSDPGEVGPGVFCSYARRDGDSVLPIARELRFRQCDVWVDQWDIEAADDWDERIDWAIDGAPTFLIFLSPNSVNSKEVRGELRVALDQDKTIVPVILEDCRIPRQLRHLQQIDAREGLAVDSEGFGALLKALKQS